MVEYSRISLLETILMDSGCRSLSSLSTMSREKRKETADHIEKEIPPEAPTLQDYNEALHYLLCMAPEKSKECARSRLLDGLRQDAF